MLGGRSFQLARIFGIRIGANTSWFIALFVLILIQSSNYKPFFPGHGSKAYVLAVASIFLLVASILLHELGHAITAVRNGVGVSGIDLWVFGGITKQSRESPNAWVDFKVSAAGPFVTLLIAAASFAVGAASFGTNRFWHAAVWWESVPAGFGQDHPVGLVVANLFFLNVLLLVFNLLPGLPLDGGRIVRAIAWWRTGDRNRATRIAAAGGRGIAFVVGAFGFLLAVRGSVVGGLWLFLIAMFIGQAARVAEAQSAVAARIEHLTVADVMDSEPVVLPSETRLDRALEEWFHRYGWDWFPVVDPAGHFLGLVSREDIEKFPEQLWATSTVSQVMSHDTGDTFRVRVDDPLEALLGSEGLQRLGALMAVDREGILRGVVTIEQVSRALQPLARTA
jgi:Zn-dependent protease